VSSINHIVSEKRPWKEQLEAYIRYNLTWIEQHPEFHRLIYEIFYSQIPGMASRILDQFRKIRQENIRFIKEIFHRANEEDQRYDPDLMSLMIPGMLHSIGDNWFLGLLNKKPTAYISRTLQLILGEDYRD